MVQMIQFLNEEFGLTLKSAIYVWKQEIIIVSFRINRLE